MLLNRFEKFLPWTGAIAGLAWIGQAFLATKGADVPGGATSSAINDHYRMNIAGLGCLILMSMALVFFAAAVRNLLRSGEAREATYSSVAYGGVAAHGSEDAALHAMDYVGFFGWSGMTIGIATALIAMGLAGVRDAVLPRWFSIVSVVLGALGALGAAHIPPGGLVNYVVLPLRLIVASILMSKRQRVAATPMVATPGRSAE